MQIIGALTMARRAEPIRPGEAGPRPERPPRSPRPERVAAFRLGLSAESRAAMLLIAKGYRIAARRFKTPVGEVDIVARRRRNLVFAEVKARESLDQAAEAVTERAKSRIVAAAEFWLAQHPDDAACYVSFDVILVAPGKVPRHITNAFDATGRARPGSP
jgi:putative endonuclease